MKSEYSAHKGLQEHARGAVAFVNPSKVHLTQTQKNIAEILKDDHKKPHTWTIS